MESGVRIRERGKVLAQLGLNSNKTFFIFKRQFFPGLKCKLVLILHIYGLFAVFTKNGTNGKNGTKSIGAPEGSAGSVGCQRWRQQSENVKKSGVVESPAPRHLLRLAAQSRTSCHWKNNLKLELSAADLWIISASGYDREEEWMICNWNNPVSLQLSIVGPTIL